MKVKVLNDENTIQQRSMKDKSYLLWIALLALPLFLLSGCLKKDDEYSLGDFIIELGNIEGTPQDFIVMTDRGERLFPSVNNNPEFNIEDNKRVWINYTILDRSSDPDIDYLVRINAFNSVLTKDTILRTPENADSLGHDPICIKDYWITNDYLNIAFEYEGSPYYVHYINMAMDRDSMSLEDGTPLFEILHNKNGDPYTRPPLRGYVSFDLRPFKDGDSGVYEFQLRALGFSGSYDFDKRITYSWGDSIE